MAVEAKLYSNPQWRFFTLTGVPATGCIFNAYRAQNHDERKTVWQDPERLIPWANPLTFDSTGASGPFYFDDDEPYFIVITMPDGETVLYAQDDFPTNQSGKPVVSEVDITNYILNPQFRLFPTQSYSSPVAASIETLAFGGWSFSKTNTSATDTLSFDEFVVGQTDVPNNPKYYLNYTCTGQGSGEITKDIIFTMDDVSTFALTKMNLQLWAQSNTNSQIEVLINQHFGTGGSPSSDVLTPLQTVQLGAAWAAVDPIIFTPPTVAGKTLGTNGDDSLQLIFRMPLNTTCNISLTNACLKIGDVVTDMQPITEEQAVAQVSPQLMALPNTVNPADGWYDKVLPQGSFNEIFISRAGKMIDWPVNTAPNYAKLCNGLMYFSADYYNLANICFDALQTDQFSIGQLAWGTGLAGFVGDAPDAVTCTATANGVVTSAADVNSGLEVFQVLPGTSTTASQFAIFFKNGDQITNSTYLEYNSPTTGYYLWFSENNTGVDPAPVGRTGVKVIYLTTDSSATIATAAATAIVAGFTSSASNIYARGFCFSNGSVVAVSDNNTGLKVNQISSGGVNNPGVFSIQAVAGSSIVNGSWLYINSPTQSYYLWFNQNNKSVDPGTNQSVLSGKKGIKVVYTGSETAVQMAALIAQQISCAQFRVPDVRGLTPRYWQNNATVVLPFPSTIQIFSAGNDTAINFDIFGYDQNGNQIIESLGGGNNSAVTSVNAYAWITTITPSGNTASTVYAGIDGGAQLPSPSKISIQSTSNNSGVTFAIDGLDFNGDPINESLVGPNNSTVDSVNTYSVIYSITPSINTTGTVQVGSNNQINSICLSQTGTALIELLINGQYSLLSGIAQTQSGIGGSILTLNGSLARDTDYYNRLALYTNVDKTFLSATGDNTGSFQLDNIGTHSHLAPDGPNAPNNYFRVNSGTNVGGSGSDGNSNGAPNTKNAGGPDTRPKNVYLNKIIYF